MDQAVDFVLMESVQVSKGNCKTGKLMAMVKSVRQLASMLVVAA